MFGIAVCPPSAADEDDATDEPVDPGLVNKMDAVTMSANERLSRCLRNSVRRYADRCLLTRGDNSAAPSDL